jgi:hypothetical protein
MEELHYFGWSPRVVHVAFGLWYVYCFVLVLDSGNKN